MNLVIKIDAATPEQFERLMALLERQTAEAAATRQALEAGVSRLFAMVQSGDLFREH